LALARFAGAGSLRSRALALCFPLAPSVAPAGLIWSGERRPGAAATDGDDVGRVSRSGVQQWEAPPLIYRAELIFKAVIDASVTDPARVGNYTIAEIAEDDGALTLRAEPDFNITLHVSTIDVTARDRK
jgi:hypothetical protein